MLEEMEKLAGESGEESGAQADLMVDGKFRAGRGEVKNVDGSFSFGLNDGNFDVALLAREN